MKKRGKIIFGARDFLGLRLGNSFQAKSETGESLAKPQWIDYSERSPR